MIGVTSFRPAVGRFACPKFHAKIVSSKRVLRVNAAVVENEVASPAEKPDKAEEPDDGTLHK
jgi:hypothetical protein